MRPNQHRAESYEYDVFGEPNRLSDVNNPYLFTARRYDNETANYYYRARYYKPSIGRFLQTDPIGYYAGLNLYTYVVNNPVKWSDPSGLVPSIGGGRPGWVPGPGPMAQKPCYFGGGTGLVEGILLPEDYQNIQKAECAAIEGYYRHCVATCRLNRITGPAVSYPAALCAGNDWPSDDDTENNESDRRADRDGIINAYKFWKSCRSSCKQSLDKAIKEHCPCP